MPSSWLPSSFQRSAISVEPLYKNPLVSVVELGRLLCCRPATLTFSDTADFVKLIRKKNDVGAYFLGNWEVRPLR